MFLLGGFLLFGKSCFLYGEVKVILCRNLSVRVMSEQKDWDNLVWFLPLMSFHLLLYSETSRKSVQVGIEEKVHVFLKMVFCFTR